MTKYKTTTLKVAVSIGDESPVFGENTVSIEVQDEAGGWYLKICDTNGAEIGIDFDQLDAIYQAAQELRKLEK